MFKLIIHNATQVFSIGLAFMWFGWKLALIVFLTHWTINTVYNDF